MRNWHKRFSFAYPPFPFRWPIKLSSFVCFFILSSFISPRDAYAQFVYEASPAGIRIIGYSGTNEEIIIPETIGGTPVISVSFGTSSNAGPLRPVRTITIPKTVSTFQIGAAACPNLTAFVVDPLNSVYSSADGILLNKQQTALLAYPTGREAGAYTVPIGVAAIQNNGFAYNAHLTNINISADVAYLTSAFTGSNLSTNKTVPHRPTFGPKFVV